MKIHRYFIISSYCAFSNQCLPFPLLYPIIQVWVTHSRVFDDLHFVVLTIDIRLPPPIPQLARNRQMKNNIEETEFGHFLELKQTTSGLRGWLLGFFSFGEGEN